MDSRSQFQGSLNLGAKFGFVEESPTTIFHPLLHIKIESVTEDQNWCWETY